MTRILEKEAAKIDYLRREDEESVKRFERRLNSRSTLPLEGRVKAGKRSSYFVCKGCSWIGG